MFAKRSRVLFVLLLLIGLPAAAPAQENPFPLGKGSMPAWYKDTAPLPFGVTLGYTRMSDDMLISNVQFVIGGQALPAGAIAVDNVTHHTTVEMMRFDMWVLPFVNVYALRGVVNGQAPGVHPSLAPIPGLPALPLPSSIDVKYDGTLYGVGATLAGGYKRFFVSYDINREWVSINLFSAKFPATAQGVRAGFMGKLGGTMNAQVYAGGFHLDLHDSVLTGGNFIPGLPGGTFSLVARPKNAWNTIVGGSIELTRHMVVTAECGFGTRKQFTVMPGVRF